MSLIFELNIRPMPHQSVRFGRNGIKYKPKKIMDYQEYVRRLVKDQLPNDFVIIEAGTPISIDYIHYCYAYPKSMAKKYKIGNVPKTTKPDLQDNLNKAFFDALEGIVFEQDQNICCINNMQKYYCEKDCIKIKINY
jgi:Holliday junction resolvase RusA-like endonuclease